MKEIYEKTMKMTLMKGSLGTDQFFVRIPKELEDFLEIKKGDSFKFWIDIKIPKEKSKLIFSIIRG